MVRAGVDASTLVLVGPHGDAEANQRKVASTHKLHFPWEPPRPDHKPCNLPIQSIGTLFKGREAFLDDLRHRLGVPGGRATAIVNRLAVHGLGGVGKTRAAVEYAWRHADDYTALLFVSAPSARRAPGQPGQPGRRAGDDRRRGPRSISNWREVLHWLDAHPGWLLIVDNVDTEEAAREVERLLARLRAGHVLITSRIGNWSAGVEPLELDVLAPADAVAFLLERTPHRRQKPDDAARAAAIARELDGLALALEQAGAYIDKLRLSFAEYLRRWEAKRPEVLRWHDPRLMQYPASVAVTWETTFAQLDEPERRLLEVLAWLAPSRSRCFLARGRAAGRGHPRPPRGAGGPGGLLAGAVRRRGRRGPGPPAGAGDHPRPHSRGRPHRHAADRPASRECRSPVRCR